MEHMVKINIHVQYTMKHLQMYNRKKETGLFQFFQQV